MERYDIVTASKREKSSKIYITCAKNKVPSMENLKKLFGAYIASFVDFRQEDVDEDGESNKESFFPSFSRKPI